MKGFAAGIVVALLGSGSVLACSPGARADSATASMVLLRDTGDKVEIRIDASGAASYFHWHHFVIWDHRAGTVAMDRMRELADTIRASGFVTMSVRYVLRPPAGTVYETQHSDVTIAIDGTTKRVEADEHAAPPELVRLVDTIVGVGRRLPPIPPPGVFLRAEPLSEDRGRRAAARVPVLDVTGELLDRHHAVRDAIAQPGRFIRADKIPAETWRALFADRSTEILVRHASRYLTLARFEQRARPG